MENTIIKNKFGKVFGSGIRGASFLFFAVGLLVIFTDAAEILIRSIAIGLLILFFSGMILFLTNGILVDLKNKRIREYYKYLFLHYLKEWKSIEDYPFVAILSFNMSSITSSRSNRANTITEKQHQVYLLNERHTQKKLIHTFLDSKQAIEFAKMITTKLDLQLTQYNPPSSRSKGRQR